MRIFLAACALVLFLAPHALYAQSTPASERPIAGLGHAHMDTSCSPEVSADFDRALALLGDPATAKTAADELERLASEPGQHPLAETIITRQAKEAQAVAAHAAGDEPRVIAMMTNAVEIEDSIEALSQPPYPIIPAHELYGTLLMELKRHAEAAKHFAEALRRTPGRPMAVYGIARAAEVRGDRSTAVARYTEFLELWKQADQDRPELAIARRFVTAGGGSSRRVATLRSRNVARGMQCF